MITFQDIIQHARKLVPRGWSPLLRYISKVYPPATMYPGRLKSSDTLYLDLSENMCHSYFYYGDLSNEKYTEAFFKTYIKPEDVVLDVGANIGYFTRILSAIVGSKGRVHAFEPMPSAIRLLKKNTETLDNVTLHEVALSNKEGTSDFFITKYGDVSSFGRDTHSASAKLISVKTDTIDNIIKEEIRIDLIKIDVEGYEYEVLMGAMETIRMKRPLLYFEYVDRYTQDRGITIENFRSLLKPLGYSLGWISPDFPNSSLISEKYSGYLIAVPEGNRWKIVI
jgi:FkbM family methyltransferase